MIVYYFKEDSRNVTEFYYNIILDAINKKGLECVAIEKCTIISALSIKKEDYVLVTTLRSFLILYLVGLRHFIFWYQGITPEEVYLMKKSRFWYYVYSYLEKLSLKTVEYKIGVSKYMFEHYKHKYKIRFSNDSFFIMPCFNSNINKNSFMTPQKYYKNIFCYAGGTQVWQGLDKILQIYSIIEKQREDVYLKIFSKDVETAKKMVAQADLKHYSIQCVPQSEMDRALSDCKFGFIIREDNIINNVATPTKMGTYLANGVIPIFSSSIYSFRDLSHSYEYLCCVDETNVIEKILSVIKKEIDCLSVYDEYQRIFSDYYNREAYSEKLSAFLNI